MSTPRFSCARARSVDEAHTAVIGADSGAAGAEPARPFCADVAAHRARVAGALRFTTTAPASTTRNVPLRATP